jgi:predicted nucleic acid-binding Zn ribbon protein
MRISLLKLFDLSGGKIEYLIASPIFIHDRVTLVCAECEPHVLFRICPECGTLIPILDNRSDRKYCSEACRVSAFRKRKKVALPKLEAIG